jgi:hypothetical protein
VARGNDRVGRSDRARAAIWEFNDIAYDVA